MQKIIFLQDYKDRKVGDIEEVSTNFAFGLIDSGVAKPYSKGLSRMLRRPPVDKMMRTEAKDVKTKVVK